MRSRESIATVGLRKAPRLEIHQPPNPWPSSGFADRPHR